MGRGGSLRETVPPCWIKINIQTGPLPTLARGERFGGIVERLGSVRCRGCTVPGHAAARAGHWLSLAAAGRSAARRMRPAGLKGSAVVPADAGRLPVWCDCELR